MRRLRFLLSIAAVAVLAIVPAACGGSDSDVSAEADPQEVLNQTFGPEGAVTSADLSAEISVTQQGSDGGDFDLSLSGPVQETEAEVPDVDLTLDMTGQMGGDDVDFNGGLTLVGDRGYVTLDGDAYEIDQAIMGQIKSQAASAQPGADGDSEEGDAGILGDLNPESFLTDMTNEGTADIDGEETVHISGTVDTEAATSELQEVLAGTAALEGLGVDVPGARELRELEQTVGNIRFDIYTGADDSLLRRMEFSVPVEDGADSGSMDVSLSLANVNEDQSIEAPENARPFAELIAALSSGALEGLGIEDLSELGGLGGAGGFGAMGGDSGSGSGDSGSDAGSGDSSGSDSSGGIPGAGPDQQAALDCLQNAQSAADIAECGQAVQ